MYGRLLEALRKEVDNEELQKLPENLYGDLRAMLQELVRRTRDPTVDRVTRRVLVAQHDGAATALTQLIETRLRKMLHTSLKGLETSNGMVADEEKDMLSSTLILARARDTLVSSLAEASGPSAPELGAGILPRMLLIRFVKEVPLIVGADMRSYGPFKTEDIALLPAPNAEALVKQGAALEVQVE